jgi:hypothetical protein
MTLIDHPCNGRLLQGVPPFSIEITLYGRTRNAYERVTEVPGSYDQRLEGTHLLTDRNLPLSLKTLLLTTNRHEIWTIRAFAEQELGLRFRCDTTVNPSLDCALQPLVFRLSPDQIVDLDMANKRRATDWRDLADRQFAVCENTLYCCRAGVNAFAVNP